MASHTTGNVSPMEQLLQTKLYIPRARPDLVSRPRLIERLNEGLDGKLTLVCAPAGFGKTTLASEWVCGSKRPVAWLSLDEGDNDAARFMTYFIAALQRIKEEVGEGALSALQSPEPPPIEALLTSLINQIAKMPDPFALVLDDYNVIEAQPIHRAVTYLLDHLPPQMHLVIATRRDPPLPVARLRASRQVTEIRASDLRFTREEAAAFLNEVMGLALSSDHVAALEVRTEGWITGLQLAALSMRGLDAAHTTSFISAFAGDDRNVVDYLVGEVLAQRPGGTKDFLLHTSILDRMTGPLCDAVTGYEGGQDVLETLEQANLFVVPLDNRREWYRYHHLFGDLLRKRLHQTQPDQVQTLHSRASEWYQQNGFVTEAIEHALAAEDFEGAARLVEQTGMTMLTRSEFATVSRWLEAMPQRFLRSRPWLCVFRAWILQRAGRFDAVEELLQYAERALQAVPIPIGSDQEPGKDIPLPPALSEMEVGSIRGNIALARALISLHKGDICSTIELAHQALAFMPAGDVARGMTGLILGIASRASGDLAGAQRAFADARRMARASGNRLLTQIIIWHTGYTQALQGQLHQAIDTLREALELTYEKGGQPLPYAGHAYADIGKILLEWNELEASMAHVMQGIGISKPARMVDALTDGHVTTARVRLAQGDLNGALEACQSAERNVQVPNPDPMTVWRLKDCKIRLWFAQGDLAAAARWIQESGLSVDDELSFVGELEHIILARVLIFLGREQPEESYLADALDLLARLLEAAETAGWMGKVIEILVLQSIALQAQGAIDRALVVLDRALTLAERENYMRLFIDEGPPMARLLYAAAARGIAPDYAGRLLASFPDAEPARTVPSKIQELQSEIVEPLSKRELEVLGLIAEGLSNREIAQRLVLSLNTVKGHTRNIYGKLGINSRTQAVAKARALGILPPISAMHSPVSN